MEEKELPKRPDTLSISRVMGQVVAAQESSREFAQGESRAEINSETWEQIWKRLRVSLEEVYPPNTPVLFRNDGEEFLHLGDLSMIEGQAGSKKTMLVCSMIAGLLYEPQPSNDDDPGDDDGRRCLGFYSPTAAENRVLYVDTEQNKVDTQSVLRRVHQMAGLDTSKDDERFAAINLRIEDTAAQVELVEGCVLLFKPTVVVLDNIADLCEDSNNLQLSKDLVKLVDALSAKHNCAVLCVIHQNPAPGGGPTKASGHLGTTLWKKSKTQLRLKVDDDITRVESGEKSRGHKPPSSFAFVSDENGIPQLTTPPMKVVSDASAEKMKELREALAAFMEPGKMYPYSDIVKRLMQQLRLSDGTCRERMRQAKEKGIIVQQKPKGPYCLPPQVEQQSIDGYLVE